ncbi:MAG: hypothetical protein HEP71_06720 [Roseivirga sp.]|nr:hypothetical protein [Roseivirga sp.]
MPEGFSGNLTFWYDDELKVIEKVYDFDSENRSMHDMVKPMVEWAKTNEATLEGITKVYLANGFKPSTENAVIWKEILEAYRNR